MRRRSSCCTAGWTCRPPSSSWSTACAAGWRVVAPDWRGYGLTDRGGSDSYWFPDYVADLDRLLDLLSPDAPAHIAGHSMGGNVAGLYAGARPARVASFVNLEGFGLQRHRAAQRADALCALARRDARRPPGMRDYADFDELAARLQQAESAADRASAPRSWPGIGVNCGRASRAVASCCAAIRRTRSSIRCSTSSRRRRPAGAP